MSVAAVVWGDEGGVTERLERLRGSVTVVRRCDELTEAVALAQTGLAEAAVLAGDLELVAAATIDALVGAGVGVVVLTDDAAEKDRLSALGAAVEGRDVPAQSLADLLELLCAAASPAVHGRNPVAEPARAPAEPQREPGRVVAVWGPAGAPGRTTVAVNLAAENALAGREVMLLDADTYGASVAVHLGLLDESAGLAQLCRLSDQGILDRQGFERSCSVLAVAGARMRVATGLPRPNRWPELRGPALGRVLDFARRRADVVVVDLSFCLETDEDLTFDTLAPQRNGAAVAVLAAADEVIAVGSADSVGVPRLVKALEELLEDFPDCAPTVVFNKVRAGAVGASPERQLRETWDRFGPDLPIAACLPWDAAAADAALLAGGVLAETAPGSVLRRALADLAGVPVQRRRGGLRRRDALM